jgi:GxxExxY protein
VHHRGRRGHRGIEGPVEYKGARIECGYRIDLLIDDMVILDLKSVDQLAPVHDAQLLTYMKLARIRTGLLINFNQQRLIDGLRRFKL